MNVHHIISEIEKTDPEIYDRLNSRRTALKNFSSFAGKVALVAVPIALGGLFKKAYGQSSTSILDVLNYALTLEYLEAEFYQKGIQAGSALIPTAAAQQAIATIGAHETAHVNFLKSAISASGGTPVTKPNFDFTAKGTFSDVFTNYQTFLAVAQTFEDTGVRAYKGQAANLMGNNDVLTAALNIHSVEARHAAHIRQMRKANNFGEVKPWITGKNTGIGAVVQASYNGEELATQAGINITNINGFAISADAASESFDEALTMQEVLSIVSPFLT